MTHTPGPWHTKAVYGLPDEDFIAVIGGDVEVCIVPPSGEVNARLIAAAPELLRHLEHLAGACERFAPHILTDEARAAIARAKGE